ncbi:MAG: hypothetical protein Q8876_08220 [Bacillota bacterium]|nr:hypothetical protein [Bacillota bacterium]
MNQLCDFIVRTALISLLEQAFVIMIILKLTKKDLKLLNKNKRICLFGLIVTQAILSNVPKLIGIDQSVSLFINFVISFAFISIIERKYILRIFVSTIIGYLIFGITEAACVSVIMRSTGIAVKDLDNNVLLTFAVSLFERVLQYSILYFWYVKKAVINGKAVDIVGVITESKRRRNTAILLVFANFIFLLVMGHAFMVAKAFNGIDCLYSLTICTVSYSMPCISMYFLISISKQSYLCNKIYLDLLSEQVKERAIKALEIAENENDGKTAAAITDVINAFNFSD